MRLSCKSVIIFTVVYIILTLVTLYRLYSDVIARLKSNGKFKCRKQFVTERSGVAVILLDFMREVRIPTGTPTILTGFSLFIPVPPRRYWVSTSNRARSLPSTSFPIYYSPILLLESRKMRKVVISLF
jgi:hypothetical protein